MQSTVPEQPQLRPLRLAGATAAAVTDPPCHVWHVGRQAAGATVHGTGLLQRAVQHYLPARLLYAGHSSLKNQRAFTHHHQR